MRKILTERFVRRAIINYLARKGWDRGLREKETAEHGVDIKVRHNKYSRYFFIETKGESTSKSAKSVREVAFVYSLGQIITRIPDSGDTLHNFDLSMMSPELQKNWQVGMGKVRIMNTVLL